MAKYSVVIEGLEILAKYSEKGKESRDVAAEHDVIYGGPTMDDENGVSAEDRDRLIALGWDFDDEVNSWRRFT